MGTVAASSTVVINVLLLLISLYFILSLSSSTADAKLFRPGLIPKLPVRGSRSRKGPHGRK